ncbi:Ca2+-binding protein, RTX toxin [Rivularia sp. PCC 7116]|uniref:DUF4347 domain-containing protein n=1 Tax=Rivularia sp. PCC 7116 TaxID=373994 RepID=UPI00029ECBC2|nr:DUF4347 domain-containing protein [Rivularia sp. PCC 7116]AFY57514.1 Ca2+-binding protein, RTX toxin [Rivularia sp. PCC 7116]
MFVVSAEAQRYLRKTAIELLCIFLLNYSNQTILKKILNKENMNNRITNILLIDSSVDSYEFLLEGIVGEVETIVLDSKRDGIEQITEVFAKTSGVETVHIVSHGSPGSLYLGNSELNLSNLEYYKPQLDNWCCQNLLIYGCNVAAGDAGEEFVEKLHCLTSANIAASKTKTGNAELGGNWELEVRVGKDFAVEKDISLIFEQHTLAEYSGVFDPNQNPVITTTNNTLNYTENALQIIDAEATITDIDSPNFNDGTLTVRFTSGNTENDRLSIRNQGTEATQINVDNTIVKYSDVEIGTFSGGVITGELVVNLNENATPTAVQALLRAIAYQNVSDNPDTTERNLEFIVTDGQGGISEAISKTIIITPVNDAPIIDKTLLRVDENAEKGTVVGTLTATDPEGTTDFSDWQIRNNSKFDLDDDGEGAFAINANTGEITVNDSDDLNYENRTYSYVDVSVSDGQDVSKFSSIRITLNDVKGTNVNGTSENDKLYGTPEAEIILGKEGNDHIYGMGGSDTLDGGEGIDTVRESADADFRFSSSGGEYNGQLYSYEANTRKNLGTDRLENIERLALTGGESNNKLDVQYFNGNANLSGKGGNDSLTGGRGNDTLSGGTGNDTLDGGEGIDTVRETADTDFWLQDNLLNSSDTETKQTLGRNTLKNIEKASLTGGQNDNFINAEKFTGNVNLSGKGGDDTLIGGYSNDILSGGEGNDSIDGGEGIDTVRETADVDFQLENVRLDDSQLKTTDSKTGSQLSIDQLKDIERVQLTGGESKNKLDASRFSGNVHLSGKGGNDSLVGGSANDTLSGGEGSDTIDGGAGIDTLREAADVDFKLTDNQLASTEVKTRNLVANDELRNIERVVLTAGESNNKIDASEFSGNVNLSGKGGRDTLIGGSGNDTLSGGEGDDTLDGGEGIDNLRETADADFRFLSSTRGEYSGQLDSYEANTRKTLGRDRLDNIERLSFTSGESNNILDLRKFSGNVNLSGKGGNDTLYGGSGNDTLSGGEGDDTLDGGEGIDNLRETADADFRFLSSTRGEYSGQLDSYEANTRKTLGRDRLDNIERLALTGGENRNKIDVANFNGNVNISGKGGRDTLIGGSGNDILSGGEDYDTLDGGEGIDTLRETADANFRLTDGQLDSYDVNSRQNLGRDRLNSIERASLTGGETNNYIDASEFSGNLNLSGKGGKDTLAGGSGNDNLNGGTESDILGGGSGKDTLSGGTGSDTLDGGDGIDTLRETADADFRFLSSSRGEYSGYLEIIEEKTRERDRDKLDDIERLSLTGGESDNRIDAQYFKGSVNLSGKGGNDSLIGSAGDDTLSGGEGNDTIDGGKGTNTLRETADVDFRLEGNPFNNYQLTSYDSQTLQQLSTDGIRNIKLASLSGGESDNRIDASQAYISVNFAGKGGSDTVIGGYFNDTLSGGEGNDTIDGGEGIDTLRETADTDFRIIGNRIESYDSNTRRNLDSDEFRNIERIFLTGGESDNNLEARDFEGNITLSGKGGDDRLISGSGNDMLSGGDGDDTLDGGEGIDTLRETADVDFSLRNNNLYTYDVESGSTLDRNGLRNIERASLTGGESNNELDAKYFDGNVNLSGKGGRDTLIGGSGNDILSGGEGDDTLDGGDGIDTLRETADVDFKLSGTSYLYSYKVNTTTILDRDSLRNIERISLTGGESNNKIDASQSKISVSLAGKNGNDSLIGGFANDTLSGGEGYDTLDGGSGIDSLRETVNANFLLTDSNLSIFNPETQRELGKDEIRNIERAILTGGNYSNIISASGFTGTTYLYGREGDDSLIGGSGTDHLNGGEGDDTLDGGDGIDYIRETVDANFRLKDTLLEIKQANTNKYIGRDTLRNIERAVLSGGRSNNVIDARYFDGSVNLYGRDGNDSLIGGKANDNLDGGQGDDTIDGGEGIDTIRETADANFRLTDDYLDSNEANTGRNLGRDRLYNIERAALTGGDNNNTINASAYTGATFLYGKAGNDTLLGGSGNDYIKAGSGDDFIDGGIGSDRLYGEGGKDTFVLSSVTGKDTIYDFEDGVDTLGLSAGLNFSDLNIKASGNHTNIIQGNQTLATLIGIDSSLIDESDFTSV